MHASTQLPEQPLRWLRQIPEDLFRLDEKPLMGSPPPFSWDEFSNLIAQHFELQEFVIQPSEWQWRSKEELLSGLGTGVRGIALDVVPLSGSLWWAMPEEQIAVLVGLLLTKDSSHSAGSIEADFLSTFYRFLAVETVHAFEQINPSKELSVALSDKETLPDTASLCMDLSIKIGETLLYGRIFLSPEFRRSWAQYHKNTSGVSDSPMLDSLETTVHLEVGHLALSTNELKKIVPGDFVVLNDCSLSAGEGKERVMLTIAGTPFFRARIKHGSLKILEHPLYYEVNTTMDNSSNENKENNQDEITDFDLDNFDSGILNAGEAETPSVNDSEQDVGNGEGEGEESLNTEVNEENNRPKTLEDIPLPVVVEIGRIQMSIRQLLELQPGNMLDINIHPESGIDLVVHGKKIAHGELLQIGDSLGVRILEIL